MQYLCPSNEQFRSGHPITSHQFSVLTFCPQFRGSANQIIAIGYTEVKHTKTGIGGAGAAQKLNIVLSYHVLQIQHN